MKKILMLLMLGISGCAIAQTPISALPVAATSTTGVEVLPVVQAAATRKMSLAQIQSWLEGSNNVWTVPQVFSGGFTVTGSASPTASATNLNFLFGNGRWFSFGPDPSDIAENEIYDASSDGSIQKPVLTTTTSGGAITQITIGNSTDSPLIALQGGVTVGAPTGGNEGATTLNAQGLFVNGVPVLTVPPPTFAYGVIDGVGSCSLSPNVATANITSCTRNSTGNYTVILANVWTAVPACTVTAGGGSEGGANADSVQEATTSLSGTYRILILAFTAAISPQDNNFQITCIGR